MTATEKTQAVNSRLYCLYPQLYVEAIRNYKTEIHTYLKQILLHKFNGKNTYKLLKSNKRWQKRLCKGHQMT